MAQTFGLFLLLCAAGGSAIAAGPTMEGRAMHKAFPKGEVCIVISIDQGAYFPSSDLTEDGYAQWESQFATLMNQNLRNQVLRSLPDDKESEAYVIRSLSARNEKAFGIQGCPGAVATIRGRITPISGTAKRNSIAYDVVVKSIRKPILWRPNSQYIPNLDKPQDPFGGAMDEIPLQTARIIRGFYGMMLFVFLRPALG